jgi:5-fold beta-flower domain-containing protein
MKKLLLIFGFCCSVNLLSAQQVMPGFQDNHHNQIGTIQQGMLFDQNHNFLGQFKSENTRWDIIDHNHKTVGYIVGDKEIQDLGNNTIAYLVPGTDYSTIVQNAQHTVIGNIKRDGTVESSTGGILGYAVSAEHMWAAAYFFSFKF